MSFRNWISKTTTYHTIEKPDLDKLKKGDCVKLTLRLIQKQRSSFGVEYDAPYYEEVYTRVVRNYRSSDYAKVELSQTNKGRYVSTIYYNRVVVMKKITEDELQRCNDGGCFVHPNTLMAREARG